ncbi:hypothetical protein D3C80_1700700 [compost metagenome]
MLALALRTAGLEGFQAAEGFDQQCLALRAQGQAALHRIAQAALNDQGEDRGERKGQQWDGDQRTSEQADHHDHQ